MFDIIVFGVALSYPVIVIIGFAWGAIKAVRYMSHDRYIYVPFGLWGALIIGVWVPIANFFALTYLLFGCKSIGVLMNARRRLVQQLGPVAVVQATEELIQNSKLVGDPWVLGTWAKKSQTEWIAQLSAKPELLREALDKKLRVHASTIRPYADWAEVIKHFLYLQGQSRQAREAITHA